MQIQTPNVPTCWGHGEGGDVTFTPYLSRKFDAQLKLVMELMEQAGTMPEFADHKPVNRYAPKASVAMERVLSEGFEVVIDALREQLAAAERQVA